MNAHVRRDVMRACLYEHLGGISRVGGRPDEPAAAVDENENRRLSAIGAINIQLFDFGRPVGDAAGRTEASTHRFAIGREPRINLSA